MPAAISIPRFHSLDVVKGLAIILMALDHIRDYWAPTEFSVLDPAYTSPAWFATRWITHFCAPAFILLAGTSIYICNWPNMEINPYCADIYYRAGCG